MQRRAFRIDIVGVIFYLILAVAVLFAVNIHTIWQFLVSQTSVSPTATVDYSAISPPLFNFLNKLSALPLMLFWAVVGTICYVFAIWLQTAFSSVFKEAKEANYVRPPAAQASYWHNTLINNMKIVGLVVGWIFLLYFFVQVLLPSFSRMLSHSLNAGAFSQRAGYSAGAIILTAVCLFLIVEISHFLKRSWRRFSQS